MSNVKILEKEDIKISIPKKYNVVFYNDDYTSFEFVIFVLIKIFHHSQESAVNITQLIHNKGRGIAGTYTKEIAEQKKIETTELAKANQFPLLVLIEEA